MKRLLTTVLVGMFFFTSTVVFAMPKLNGYINDNAEILSQELEDKLETELGEYEEKTTNQIFVLTTSDLENKTLEEYSIDVAEAWQPGQEGVDNGILLLIATEERGARIEVGRGLEGSLTDIESNDILEAIIPSFQEQKFDEGLEAGIWFIQESIASDSALLATPVEEQEIPVIFIIVGICIWIGIIIGAYAIDPNLGELLLRLTFLFITLGKASGTSGKGGKFSGGGSSGKY